MVTCRRINGRITSTKGFETEYPFSPHFLNINGHLLHYLDEGTGPPVVMVHGNPTWSFYFRHQVARLSSKFRALAPDHIGCGLSDKPGTDVYNYTLASRVADLDVFLARTVPEGKLNLIVHDWGGMIGLAWALDHPERINRVVITNTSGFFLPKIKRFPWMLWVVKYLDWFAVPAVLGLNLFAQGALYLGACTRLQPEIKKGLITPYNSWKNRIATLRFVQDIPMTPADPAWEAVARVDKKLHRLNPEKILFLWGARDFVFDTCFLDEFMSRLPGAESHVFKDAGHYLFEDKPEETADLIHRFLIS